MNFNNWFTSLTSVLNTIEIWDIMDVLIMTFVIYQVLSLAKKSRITQILKGIAVLIAVYIFAANVGLKTVVFILNNLLQFGFVAVIVVFQPEIRRFLEQMGRTNFLSLFSFQKKTADEVEIEIDGDDYDLEELYELFEECEEDDIDIKVSVTLDSDGYLINIEGAIEEDDEDDTVKGEVKSMSYDEDEEEGYIKISGTKYYVEDTDDVTVKIDGSTEDYEELYDLYEDDEYLYVTLTLDSDDYIKKIVASTEESEEVEGEIDDIDDDYIEIDGDEYELDSSVDIDIENGDYDIDNLDDLIEAVEAGFIIEVTALVEDDEVIEIEGEVVEVTGYLLDYDDDCVEIETDWDDFTYEFDDSDDYDDFEEEVEELMEEEDLDEDEIEVTFTLENGIIVDYSLDY